MLRKFNRSRWSRRRDSGAITGPGVAGGFQRRRSLQDSYRPEALDFVVDGIHFRMSGAPSLVFFDVPIEMAESRCRSATKPCADRASEVGDLPSTRAPQTLGRTGHLFKKTHQAPGLQQLLPQTVPQRGGASLKFREADTVALQEL